MGLRRAMQKWLGSGNSGDVTRGELTAPPVDAGQVVIPAEALVRESEPEPSQESGQGEARNVGQVQLINLEIDITDELLDADQLTFVYVHALHGEGICAECAPWLGMQTVGDGEPGGESSDGVPFPPLHPRCRCYLMLLEAAKSADYRPETDREEAAWLESLPPQQLAGVVGEARAGIFARGEVKLADMYFVSMPLTLDEMGYDTLGQPIDERGNSVLRADGTPDYGRGARYKVATIEKRHKRFIRARKKAMR